MWLTLILRSILKLIFSEYNEPSYLFTYLKREDVVKVKNNFQLMNIVDHIINKLKQCVIPLDLILLFTGCIGIFFTKIRAFSL